MAAEDWTIPQEANVARQIAANYKTAILDKVLEAIRERASEGFLHLIVNISSISEEEAEKTRNVLVARGYRVDLSVNVLTVSW
jgi:hypothetical protein